MANPPDVGAAAGADSSGPRRDARSWGVGPGSDETASFLRGPHPRGFELVRACRIFFELMRGFRSLHFVGPCVTVFGSARFGEEHGLQGHNGRGPRHHGGGQEAPGSQVDDPWVAISSCRRSMTYGPRLRRRWYFGE